MTNAYFNHTTATPYSASTGVSYDIHTEFDRVEDGFDLITAAIAAAVGGAIPDGDKGDIVVSGTGAVWTIDAGVVTPAKTTITGTPTGAKYLRDDWSWQAAVTSVAATVPSVFSIAGSPITSSGTLAITYSGTALPVANGGTGDTALTVYAPLFGGTTTTGAVQSGAVGTAGQVLTSNGAAAIATFQAVPAGSPGGANTQVQYNNAGVFGASATLVMSGGTKLISTVDIRVNSVDVGTGAYAEATNAAVGKDALSSNAAGVRNSAFGREALLNCVADTNTASGAYAAWGVSYGIENCAHGAYTLYDGGFARKNVAHGAHAMEHAGPLTFAGSFGVGCIYIIISAGTTNWVAIGSANNNVGTEFTATGVGAGDGYAISVPEKNVAVGHSALNGAVEGNRNVCVGNGALSNVTTGQNITAIGNVAGTDAVRNITTGSNEIVVGNNTHTAAYIKIAWTVTSDARDKTSFAFVPMGLAFVCALRPVSYRFRTSRDSAEPCGRVRYGFKAQEVLAIERSFGTGAVVIDDSDRENLKYNADAMIPILVRAIQELRAEVVQLKIKRNQ